MAPKKVTRREMPKRKIVISAVEIKKEFVTKGESGTRLSNLAAQYASYYYYTIFLCMYIINKNIQLLILHIITFFHYLPI
jgi:uncharacterized phage-associated protein